MTNIPDHEEIMKKEAEDRAAEAEELEAAAIQKGIERITRKEESSSEDLITPEDINIFGK